jgi:hypothetical protein
MLPWNEVYQQLHPLPRRRQSPNPLRPSSWSCPSTSSSRRSRPPALWTTEPSNSGSREVISFQLAGCYLSESGRGGHIWMEFGIPEAVEWPCPLAKAELAEREEELLVSAERETLEILAFFKMLAHPFLGGSWRSRADILNFASKNSRKREPFRGVIHLYSLKISKINYDYQYSYKACTQVL